MIRHLRHPNGLIIWDWPLHLGFVSVFLHHRAIHRFLGMQCSNRTEISASFLWPSDSTEPPLQSNPPGKEKLFSRHEVLYQWFFSLPAKGHGSRSSKDWFSSSYSLQGKSQRKIYSYWVRKKTSSLPNPKILCFNVFKFQQNFHLVLVFFFCLSSKTSKIAEHNVMSNT